MRTKLFAAFLSVLLILAFSACSVEIRNPVKNPEENIAEPEEKEEKEPILSEESAEPEEIPEETNPLEGIDEFCFASFEEITALGYYPLWMQPNSIIIYDENGIPEIIEGGVITEEDSKEEEFSGIWYFDRTIEETMKIKANTKVEYFTDGFIQNIYYLWPDGNYNLAPFGH